MGEYTNEDLKKMQSWDLQKKIQVSMTRLLEWYKYWNGKCYVSFSGGKDSTVLADLVARVCKATGYKLILWFSDTGLEFPEVRNHAKTYGDWLKQKYDIDVETAIDYPKDKEGKRIGFRKVLEKYGYPVISKEVANKVCYAKPQNIRWQQLHGEYINPKTGELSTQYNFKKYEYLLDADFLISDMCCTIMKRSRQWNMRKRRASIRFWD